MNYQRIYDEIIDRGRTRGRPSGYFERHHIVPKSMGGTDDKSNIVNLTAREHFIAHWLLAKIHGGHQWASVSFFKQNGNRYLNSRLYSIAKLRHAKVVSELQKGVPLTGDRLVKARMHCNKLSAAAKGKPIYGERRKRLIEHCKSLSQENIGRTNTLEARAKMSASLKISEKAATQRKKINAAKVGVPRSAETREKISSALRGRPFSAEHRAKLSIAKRTGKKTSSV